MQRYRINYQLLIGLFVGSIVLSITLFFLWKWQVNRKATWYRDRSQLALEEEDILDAFQYMEKFVKLRREDEQARIELADIAFDILELEGLPIEERMKAFGIIGDTVRRTGDPAARRNLADLLFESGSPQSAIIHYEELLKESDDPELKAMHVRALFRSKDYQNALDQAFELIGFNKETEEFEAGSAQAADQPEIYSTVASVLVEREDEPELAALIIDQMVAVNPDSAVAHLQRSEFLYGRGDKESAAEELAEAFQLDPNNADVVYRKAAVAHDESEFEESLSFASSGVERFPEQMRFYQLKARANLGLENQEEALKVLDQAIEEFGEERSLELILYKIDILLTMKDLSTVAQEIDRLEDLKNPRLQPLIEYQRARATFISGDWAAAANQLRKVRPQLVGFGGYQAIAGTMLADAYEKLGKLDLAREIFEIVANDEVLSSDHPAKIMARSRLERIESWLGLREPAQSSDINALVDKMLALPEDERDWGSVDQYIDELVESRGLSEVQRKLLQGRVFSKRKLFKEARDVIREAAQLDPNDVSVRFAAVQLLLQELPDGPAQALMLLQRIEEQSGISLLSRGLMAEAIMAIADENVQDQLHSLLDGVEDWNDQEKMRLHSTIGLKFLSLGNLDEATAYLKEAAEFAPNNLPLRIQLFEIAYQQQDDEAMREAQKGILELVKDEKDGNYVLTEVKRRLIAFRGNEQGHQQLLEARQMLDEALKIRPQWHELHIAYGKLLLMTRQDFQLALQHFDDALKYGLPSPHAVSLQVRLLAQSGLAKQALQRMELIPKNLRISLLGRLEADILMVNGQKEAAFESAQKFAELQPDDAMTQAWFGNLAEQSGEHVRAAEAYRKAIELSPKNHEYWMKLASNYALAQDQENLESTMRAAQLALDPEYIPLIQAKIFELQGLWRNAEDIYEAMYPKAFENPVTARRMATFYILWGQRVPEIRQKAAVHLNTILRAANEGELPFNDTNVIWAREQAAKLLAATPDHRNSQKALRILRQASDDGTVPQRFLPLYTTILSNLADPVSLNEAIELLSQMNQQRLLDKAQVLLLARLYARTNRWEQGKELMLDALSRFGTDHEVWTAYIELLIGQGEYSTAQGRINRFADIAPNPVIVYQLRAKLAHKRGDQAEVRKLLREMLPSKDLRGALTKNELGLVKAVAGMAIAYGQYQEAETLLRLYVRRNPDGGSDLMTLLALHGDLDQALEIMQQLAVEQPMTVAPLAVQVARSRRAEFGNKYDDPLWAFVASAVEENPADTSRLLLKAEMLEVLERYDESIAAYEAVLKRDDLAPPMQAAAMNNLAYLLAQTNQRLDEAQQLIDTAIEILGPLADIMDTRAVIRMSRKEYDLAVQDMELALSIDPTALKYYHMAQVQALAGNAEEAIEAWDKANEMRIEKETLPLIEQPGYEETERLIDDLQA